MAINRFYQPQIQQYVSQFVPENLQLMQNAINLRQNQYDRAKEELNIYEDALLKQQALTGTDTDVYLKQLRDEFNKANEGFLGRDLGDPSVARDVSRFVRKFQQDDRVKKLNEGLALKAKHDELVEKYKGVDYAYIPALDRQWLNAWETYKNQTGDNPKFAADLLRGYEVFDKGVNVYKAKEEKFQNLSADMVEKLRNISEGDITRWYKEGKGGVEYDKILKTAYSEFDDFLREQAGKQQALMFREKYPNLSEEELVGEMFKDFLATGKKRQTEKITTTAPTALNEIAKRKEEKQDAAMLPVVQAAQTPLIDNFDNVKSMDKSIQNGLASTDPRTVNNALTLQATKDKNEQTWLNNLAIANPTAAKVFSLGRNELLQIPGIEEEYKKIQKLKTTGGGSILQGTSDIVPVPIEESSEEELKKAALSLVGANYKELTKEREDAIIQGSFAQTVNIAPEVSSKGKGAKAIIADALRGLVNNNAWLAENKTNKGEEVDIPHVLNNLDNYNINLNLNQTTGSIAFEIATKEGSDEKAIQYSIAPSTADLKTELEDPNSATYQLIKTIYGDNEKGFADAIEDIKLASIPIVPVGSRVSSTNDLLEDSRASQVIGDYNIQYDRGNSNNLVLVNSQYDKEVSVENLMQVYNSIQGQLSPDAQYDLLSKFPQIQVVYNPEIRQYVPSYNEEVDIKDPLTFRNKEAASSLLYMQYLSKHLSQQ